jgi:aspartate 1-decarboxylase
MPLGIDTVNPTEPENSEGEVNRVTQVDQRNGTFGVMFLGQCLEGAAVRVIDANDRTVILSVTNEEEEEQQ